MGAADAAFSPLDEELELGTERFDPWVTESIALLGTVLPFGRVPLVLERLTRVPVRSETVRRVTEAIGRAQVGRETVEAERVRATLPLPTQGPAVQQLSLDGAMVPVVGGEWAEVKTLALGEVTTTTSRLHVARLKNRWNTEMWQPSTPPDATAIAVIVRRPTQ